GVQRLAEKSPDFAALLKDLLLLLHRVALLQAVPDAWQPAWGEREPFEALAAAMHPEETQLYYQIALSGQRDLPLAPDAQSGFEMILLRMLAFRPAEVSQAAPAPTTHPAPTRSAAAPAGERPAPAEAPPADTTTAAAPAREAPAEAVRLEGAADWYALLPRLGLSGMAAQLASHSVLQSWDGHTLVLAVDASCASMLGTRAEERLLEALRCELDAGLRLQWQQGGADDTPAARQQAAQAQREQAAREAMASDPLVQALQERFDGELDPESVRPIQS
ncbi:MAG TPA: DNA polymerase III subunit gamma/tau, partial [Gammaproteobacteria bacterium]|nr:DNA polymerase III subunit gamma/tau [Gammaproteobacteria bacterium]